MKGLFGASNARSSSSTAGGSKSPNKFHLPPFPHPFPETGLSLHCTKEGLYILPIRHGSNTSTRFRPSHSPRTSISATTEDIARDVKLARGSSLLRLEGAKIEWGREGQVSIAKDVNVKSLHEESGQEVLCYGVLGIQRLFNGELNQRQDMIVIAHRWTLQMPTFW